MIAPPNPYRCPPGPYERVSMVAHVLKQSNPTAKILVVDDMLGLFRTFKPKFVKRYAHLGDAAEAAIATYAAEVRSRSFPASEHVFSDTAPNKGATS